MSILCHSSYYDDLVSNDCEFSLLFSAQQSKLIMTFGEPFISWRSLGMVDYPSLLFFPESINPLEYLEMPSISPPCYRLCLDWSISDHLPPWTPSSQVVSSSWTVVVRFFSIVAQRVQILKDQSERYRFCSCDCIINQRPQCTQPSRLSSRDAHYGSMGSFSQYHRRSIHSGDHRLFPTSSVLARHGNEHELYVDLPLEFVCSTAKQASPHQTLVMCL